jgi:serine/threonine protein kinase
MNSSKPDEAAIFDSAVDLDSKQRSEYLTQACGKNVELRQRVEVLLAAHDRGSDFMAEPAAAASPESIHPSLLVSNEVGDKIGNYKLLQQIGEGGCGVVYMAEQQEPVRRRVALKVIRLGMDTKNVVARFQAERQALALMDHPNIAKIFDAGADSGRPFFVMELVGGRRITDFCDENKVSTKDRLKVFVQVCQAIQHAHQKGVIHRDIKPSNVLVTMQDGVSAPKVIDFGIAKATTDQRLTNKTVFTAFEQFLGTPAYMSPEQAEMSESGIDTRSDIYSLGVLLYELLTGVTPFDSRRLRQAGLDEMRRVIRDEEPMRPSTRLTAMTSSDLADVARRRDADPAKLGSLIRGELDWIVLKALEKDRNRRYATANELATDVERFLADEPVAACPPSGWYRFQKIVRRNRLMVAAVSAVVCALVIGLGISLWEFAQMSRAEREQKRLRQAAQSQELIERRNSYAVNMNLLRQALQEDNLGRATELLNQQRPKAGEEDLRGWEWRYWWQYCKSDASAVLCQRKRIIGSISFSSSDSAIAVTTETGNAPIYDVHGAKLIRPDQVFLNWNSRAIFAPSEDILAYPEEHDVVLWNERSHHETRRLPVGGDLAGLDLQFLSGTRLLIAKMTGTNNLSVWDTKTGVELTNFTANFFDTGVGMRFAATAEGGTIACVASDKVVRVMETARGRDDWSFPAAEELVTALAFSPDGKILATGGGYTESTIKLWNVQTRQFAGQMEGHRSWVTYLKFLPDGTLASASADQTVRLWDTAARKPLRTLRGHRSEVRVLAVSNDGRTLASGDKEGTVLLWDLSSITQRPPGWSTVDPKYNPRPIRTFTLSPDSRMIATVESNSVRLYDTAALHPLPAPDLGLTGKARQVLFSPDSRLVAATDYSGHVGVYDVVVHRQITNFTAHPTIAGILGSSFFRHGKSLLTYGMEGVAKEWDAETWREIAHWPLRPQQTAFPSLFSASSPNGLLAYKMGGENFIHVLFVTDPAKVRQVACLSRMVHLAFSPDGNTIAGACEEGSIQLWDSVTLSNFATLHGVLLGLHSVAFSPDGRRIVGGSNGKEAIKIWDFDSREDLGTLEGEGSFFRNAQFSSDGNMIAARNWNGKLHLWRAPSWAEIKSAERTK